MNLSQPGAAAASLFPEGKGARAATITVIGSDGSDLSSEARARLDGAALVTGPERVIRRVRPAPGVTSVPGVSGRDLLRTLDEHLEHGGGPAVVLADGDPGFFGAVRSLRAHGLAPEVLPATSVVSRAFARAGLAWDDALVVAPAELRRAVNVCRAHHKVAVLAAPGVGPGELARELAPTTPRALIVFEDLGGPGERVTHSRMGEATTRPWREPDVVLILDPRHRPSGPVWLAGARPGPGRWATGGSADDGLGPVARAFALARLGPRLGDLVWDIGAGHGEVAVDCARFGAAVIAVERDAARCDALRRHVIANGVKVALTCGPAPPALEPLPDPDAAFVAGGWPDVIAACAERGPSSLVCAVRAADLAPAVLAIMRERGYHAEAVRIEAARPAEPAVSEGVFIVHGTLR
ncbi:bifunctional cobalt-precorrin-7 (C(5))-methyltransferase CbiE/decarboxylating cobalt-precorrin-6B (C(15))-methyltransferase CbiT [Spongiactinospora sp. TRM90649]|uniref:bifunctional cobalt-precorrin-7 (C(5))-methyltransferase CbiE/decarboxylating cobalt-precorrin-6B (C(15))-methyltransferase CbiT n=1 Tax=Spongiactinospora sp. TRM90649 TaxID=3031114 RepID=UPI0023F62CE8|nr:bifunctional cobalt-precorrin-7 (C(5))-methyltransferase CbiE/decarboxylating cobalt-precorrin-6B (C(15))-methyltransferase CbiT [Spongiactinospora sp. TRM90649]MDF5758698.1 SAM-dependent methyltransferase [Spongiactinospora sp. TRM90649]